MRKCIVSVLLVIGIAAVGHAQEMPIEIKNFLDNYIKDSTAKYGPLEYKKRGIIPKSIQIKDLRLRAIQVYGFKMFSLDEISLVEYSDTVDFSEIIMPTNRWRILVMAHSKPLYEFWVEKRDGKLEFGGSSFPSPGSSFECPMWEPLLEIYPESTGINPVFVTTFPSFMLYNRGINFLYFKQKGSRKVHYIKRTYGKPEKDTLATLFNGSMENLDDSRKLLAYRRKQKPTYGTPMSEEMKQRLHRRGQAAENEGQK